MIDIAENMPWYYTLMIVFLTLVFMAPQAEAKLAIFKAIIKVGVLVNLDKNDNLGIL